MRCSTKITLSLLLVIAMILPMIPMTVFATSGVSMSIIPSTTSAESGDSITFTVNVDTNSGFSMADIYVVDDMDAFEFVSMSTTGTVFSGTLVGETANNMNAVWGDGSGDSTTTGKFFDITLKVKEAVSGEVTVSLRDNGTFNANGDEITPVFTSATITIAGAEAEAKAGYNNGGQYLTYAEAKADNYTLTAPGEGSYYFAGWFSGLENAAGITVDEDGYYILSAGTASGTSFNITESRPKYDSAPAEDAVYHALWVYDDESAIRSMLLGVVGNTVTFYSTTGDNTNMASLATAMMVEKLIAVNTTGYVKMLHDMTITGINLDNGIGYSAGRLDLNGNTLTSSDAIKIYMDGNVLESSYGKGEIVSTFAGAAIEAISSMDSVLTLRDLKITGSSGNSCVQISKNARLESMERCELVATGAGYGLYLYGSRTAPASAGAIDGCTIVSEYPAIRNGYATQTIDMISNTTMTSADEDNVIRNSGIINLGANNTFTSENSLLMFSGGTVNFTVANGTYQVASTGNVFDTDVTVTNPAGYLAVDQDGKLTWVAAYEVNYYNSDGTKLLYTESVAEGSVPQGYTPTYGIEQITTYDHLGWAAVANDRTLVDLSTITGAQNLYDVTEIVTLEAAVLVTVGEATYQYTSLANAVAAAGTDYQDVAGQTVTFKLLKDDSFNTSFTFKNCSYVIDLNGHALNVKQYLIKDYGTANNRKITVTSTANEKGTLSFGVYAAMINSTVPADIEFNNVNLSCSGAMYVYYPVIQVSNQADMAVTRSSIKYNFKDCVITDSVLVGAAVPVAYPALITIENTAIDPAQCTNSEIVSYTDKMGYGDMSVSIDTLSTIKKNSAEMFSGVTPTVPTGYTFGDLDGEDGPETWYGLIPDAPTVDGAEVGGTGKAPEISKDADEITFTDDKIGDRDSLTVNTSDVSMNFLKDALASIAGLNTGNAALTFVGKSVTPGEKELHRISLELTAGGAKVDFNGDVVVTFDFQGEEGKEYAVYYVNNDGTYETVKNSVYDHASGKMTFTANHFSDYVVRETSGSYTATLDITETEVRAGGNTVTVNVDVQHSLDSVYNAGQIVITFDSTLLTFDQASSTLPANAQCKVDGNTLTVAFFGNVITMPHKITLVFTTCNSVNAETVATVTLTDAKFADSLDAVQESDLLDAVVETESDTVTILFETFDVTLDDTVVTGASEAVKGQDYTFSITKDPHYTYTVGATVNDATVTVTESETEPGKYTIAGTNVTGPIEITVSSSANQYEVTFTGETPAVNDGATATHDTAYHFTLPTLNQYAFNYTITVGGASYTGATQEGNVITIPGADITGAIVVNITKTQTEFNVTLNGADAAWADSDADGKLETDDTITVTVTPAAGYAYEVTATQLNGQALTVTNNGNNTHTISGFTSDVTITVTKTLIGTAAVSQYIQLENQKMFLVTYSANLADNAIPYYDGKAMFWSDEYNAYCYLVVADALTEETAFAAITVSAGDKAAQTIVYTYNVNGSTSTDAADAQLVYDMYMAMYQDFDTVSMKKFLLADVDHNQKVDMDDAAEIISEILGLNTNP